MMNILLIILTAIFIIESIFEVRYFYQIRTIFNQSGRIEPTKRVQRIITIETQWSWISWIFLLLLFVLPDMYLGSLVELAETEELFAHPMHPYTQALLSAIPEPNPDEERSRQRIMLQGTLPNPVNLKDECKFCSRCPAVSEDCRGVIPPLVEVTPGHWVACRKCR